jgi:DNA-binding SARP family transcriptional activator
MMANRTPTERPSKTARPGCGGALVLTEAIAAHRCPGGGLANADTDATLARRDRLVKPSDVASCGRSRVTLRIQLLGEFRVQAGDRLIPDSAWRLQKARCLIKLLALAARHRLGRDEVMDRLWPEAEPEAALNNFCFALHVARGALERHVAGKTAGLSVLQLADGFLALAPPVSMTVDVEAFELAAAAAWQSKESRAYCAALDLYGGELLPEDRYADWTTRPRERLRDVHLQLLWELARLHRDRGEYSQAIGTLTRVLGEEPTHEEACVSLMRLHAAAGQRWNALREYAQLRTALREELDVEPGAATQRLYAEILTGGPGRETGKASVRSNVLRCFWDAAQKEWPLTGQAWLPLFQLEAVGSASMVAFVLVHGGWAGGWQWREAARR